MIKEKKREHALVQLGQKAVLITDGKCLILEDSALPGHWDLPGGRLEPGETLEEAFRREVREELGITNFDFLAVVDCALVTRKSQKKETICLIAHLIRDKHESITISGEHRSYLWVSEPELDSFEFVWPAMKRMVLKGFEYHKLLANEK